MLSSGVLYVQIIVGFLLCYLLGNETFLHLYAFNILNDRTVIFAKYFIQNCQTWNCSLLMETLMGSGS